MVVYLSRRQHLCQREKPSLFLVVSLSYARCDPIIVIWFDDRRAAKERTRNKSFPQSKTKPLQHCSGRPSCIPTYLPPASIRTLRQQQRKDEIFGRASKRRFLEEDEDCNFLRQRCQTPASAHYHTYLYALKMFLG
jgi:hypothetical protein